MAKSTNVGTVAVDLNLNTSKYNNQLNEKIKGTESAFSNSFKKIGTFVASAFAVKKIADFSKTCIDSASKVQNAFTGLNSIVQGTGNSFSQAQDFINKYTADGLVSIEETATAYKNLLSRGYDSSQIEDVLNRLKDSAAFGRQASYDLGEAVVTATEGLKNENSILVDNAGVTKNVAKMWEEYAKHIGKSSTALTQAEKIQAEYNGIMNETKFQVGDAANYTKTFSGQMQQLKFNFNQMTVAIGKVVTPLAQLFLPIINSAITAVTRFFEKIQVVLKTFGLTMPDVVSKTSDSIAGIGENSKQATKDAVNSAKKISKAFSDIDEIHVLSPLKNKDETTGASGTQTSKISKDEIITPKLNDKKFLKTIELLKKRISSIWNSKPVQAFGDAIVTIGNNVWNFWKMLCDKFMINSSVTWSKIKDNVSTILDNMTFLWSEFWMSVDDAIKTWDPIITNSVGGVFNSIWNDAIDPAIQLITQVWTDFTNLLVELWNKYGKSLADKIGEFVNNTVQSFQSLWDNIIEPIVKPFLESLSWLWDKHLKDMFEQMGEFVGKIANAALDIYNKFVYPVTMWVQEKVAPIWSFLSSLIIDSLGTAVAFISDVTKNTFKILNGLIDFISGVFSGNWKKAWEGIKGIFKGTMDSLWSIAKTPINLIIDGINALIRGINKISFDAPDWVPVIGGKKWGFHIKTIPKLAQGAYFRANNPQLAVVGDNKSEPEIITPESKIYEQSSKAIKDNNAAFGNNEMRLVLEVRYEDGRKIIKKINQTQFEAGEVLLEI